MAGGGTDYYGMQYPSCYSPATQGYSTPAAPGQASVAAPGAYPGTMMGLGQALPPGGPGASSGIVIAIFCVFYLFKSLFPPEYSHAPPSSSTTSLVSGPPSSSAVCVFLHIFLVSIIFVFLQTRPRSPGATPAPLTAANVQCKYQDSNVGSPQARVSI